MNYDMNYDKAPSEVLIAGTHCCKYNNCGKALYRLREWPFNVTVSAGETMWRWTTDGLGATKSGAVEYSGAPLGALFEAVRQAENAAGDFVRQLLRFEQYKEYDDR